MGSKCIVLGLIDFLHGQKQIYFQNISSILHRKSPTEMEEHEGESTMTGFSFFGELSLLNCIKCVL